MSEQGSDTHPPRSARLEAVTSGWKASGRGEPSPAPKTHIIVRATEFVRPLNVAIAGPKVALYGQNQILMNAPPYTDAPNAAEFEFQAPAGGMYRLAVEYAAESARPVRIILNGSLAIENALNAPTGCWPLHCQQWVNQGRVQLRQGLNVMRIERASVFPHIRTFRLNRTIEGRACGSPGRIHHHACRSP